MSRIDFVGFSLGNVITEVITQMTRPDKSHLEVARKFMEQYDKCQTDEER